MTESRAIYKRGLVVLVPLTLAACAAALKFGAATSALDDTKSAEQAAAAASETARRRADEARAAKEEQQRRDEAADQRQRELRGLIETAPTFTAEEIAKPPSKPDAIALDASYVAWLSSRSGEVAIAPRGGGDIKVVATGELLSAGRTIALGNGYVYWLTQGDEGAVRRARLPDGAPETLLATGYGLSALALDGEAVYFARVTYEDDGSSGVFQLPRGANAARRLLTPETAVCAIAVDGSAVYAVAHTHLWRAPKDGGARRAIAEAEHALGCSVWVDDEHVYWVEEATDRVLRDDKRRGGAKRVIATIPNRPTNLVTDRGFLYVTAEDSPGGFGDIAGVFRVPLRGAPGGDAGVDTAEEVLRQRRGLSGIAARDGEVYAVDFDSVDSIGAVLRLRPISDGGP